MFCTEGGLPNVEEGRAPALAGTALHVRPAGPARELLLAGPASAHWCWSSRLLGTHNRTLSFGLVNYTFFNLGPLFSSGEHLEDLSLVSSIFSIYHRFFFL